MKARKKTVLLIAIALLDCMLGAFLINGILNENRREKIVDIKTSSNYVDDTVTNVKNDILVTLEAEKISKELESASKNVTQKLNSENQAKTIEKSSETNKTTVTKKETSNAATSNKQTTTTNQKSYKGMTTDQIAAKLNKFLKSDLAGKGNLIATYSVSNGVDPFVATAIMLVETGCNSGNCSRLVKACNNVGGMVGGSGCNGYMSFETLDVGIKKFIDNLAKNYYAQGLDTPEKMNPKYAASKTWSVQVNTYVAKLQKN